MIEADIRRMDEIEGLRDENAVLRAVVEAITHENAALRAHVADLMAAVDPAKLSTLQAQSLLINQEWKAETPGPFDRLGDVIGGRSAP